MPLGGVVPQAVTRLRSIEGDGGPNERRSAGVGNAGFRQSDFHGAVEGGVPVPLQLQEFAEELGSADRPCLVTGSEVQAFRAIVAEDDPQIHEGVERIVGLVPSREGHLFPTRFEIGVKETVIHHRQVSTCQATFCVGRLTGRHVFLRVKDHVVDRLPAMANWNVPQTAVNGNGDCFCGSLGPKKCVAHHIG